MDLKHGKEIHKRNVLAYDFVHLHRGERRNIQFGGSYVAIIKLQYKHTNYVVRR